MLSRQNTTEQILAAMIAACTLCVHTRDKHVPSAKTMRRLSRSLWWNLPKVSVIRHNSLPLMPYAFVAATVEHPTSL